jgi:hypothetical protein
MPLKVAVLGNCQGQFYQSLFGCYKDRFEVLRTRLLYTQNESYTEEFHSTVDQCDFVVSRHLGPGLRFAPAITNNLRERLGDRLIVFPNIYYNGYFPDFFVPYGQGGKAIGGLAGDYHSRTIYQAYKDGLSEREAADAVLSDKMREAYPEAASQSRKHLEEVEAETDVAVSDLIVDGKGGVPALHTYNHPTNAVMYALFGRILQRMGLDPIEIQGDPLARYALDTTVLPVFPHLTAGSNLAPSAGSYTWRRRLPPEQWKPGHTHRAVELDEIVSDAYARFREAGVPRRQPATVPPPRKARRPEAMMIPALEKLSEAWDEMQRAMQRLQAAAPDEMTEATDAVARAHRAMGDAVSLLCYAEAGQ